MPLSTLAAARRANPEMMRVINRGLGKLADSVTLLGKNCQSRIVQTPSQSHKEFNMKRSQLLY
jgi:hypothetical protein